MRRFQRIDTEKELMLKIVEMLHNNNYKRVPDCTGGDEDFLMIDTLRKEYIWCENGFAPFCSDDCMMDYEFLDNPKSISLKQLEKNRY